MKSPTVAEITPAVGVSASPKGADIGRFPPQYAVGTGPRITDEQREAAIERAARLMEFFMGERSEAITRRDLPLAATALCRADKARELMEDLIRGRSPAYVAFLERQRGLDLPACANEARGG